MKKITEYLEKHGESMDKEIAKGTGLPLETVRAALEELSEKGAIISCHVTRYNAGNKTEGISSRMAGFVPQHSAGRKPKGEALL